MIWPWSSKEKKIKFWAQKNNIGKIIKALGDSEPIVREKAVSALEIWGDCKVIRSETIPTWLNEWSKKSLKNIAKNLETVVQKWHKCPRDELRTLASNNELDWKYTRNLVLEYLIGVFLREKEADFVYTCTRIEIDNYGKKTKTATKITTIETEELGGTIMIHDGDYLQNLVTKYKLVGRYGNHNEIWAEILSTHIETETTNLTIPLSFSEGMDKQEIESYFSSYKS